LEKEILRFAQDDRCAARSLAPLGMTKVLRWDDSKAKAQKELK